MRNNPGDSPPRGAQRNRRFLWVLIGSLIVIALLCAGLYYVGTVAGNKLRTSVRPLPTSGRESVVPTTTQAPTVVPTRQPTEGAAPTRQSTVTESPTPARITDPTKEPSPRPTSTPAPRPTNIPTPARGAMPLTVAQIRESVPSIQKVLSLYLQALSTGHATRLTASVDQSNRAWVSIARENVQDSRLRYQSVLGIEGRVYRVVPQINGFYRVTAELTYVFANGKESFAKEDYTFRYFDGKWRVSEPRATQLGKVHYSEGEHIVLKYYDWDAWQSKTVLNQLDNAVAHTSELLHIKPRNKVVVNLIPSYSALPYGMTYSQDGFYRFFDHRNIYLRSPGTEGFGSYGLDSDPTGTILYSTTAHETTHLLQDQVVNLSRLPGWMSEGLAGWVAREDRRYTLVMAIEDNDMLSVTQLGDNFAALPSKDVLIAYAEAEDMVDYIAKTKGIRAYWVLVRAYERTGSLNRAFEKALRMSPKAFERRWERWVKNKYKEDLARVG